MRKVGGRRRRTGGHRVEPLEGRRLLCIEGVGEPGEEIAPVHLFDSAGHHLSLPDASTVDIVAPEPAPAPDFIGPMQAAALPAEAAAAPAASGALNGKIAYVNAGHGWTRGTSSWNTQRPEYAEIVEDLQTQDQITYYADYMLRAGATVVPTRPLAHQTKELIVDNNDPGFSTPVGSWSTNNSLSTYWSNVSGNDTTNRYRFASQSATETAVARWTPNITHAGFYPVYAWWNNGGNRSTEALFRINSAGGSQEVKVNQRFTGKGWVYLGNHYFDAGTGGNVELSNKTSGPTGSVVIADAIRFGNGMGDWTGNGAHPMSGKPREEELSLYWLYRSRGYTGANAIVPESVVDGGVASDSSAGVAAPPRWISYMNEEAQGTNVDRLHLSVHSNGSTGNPDTATARGTEGLLNNTVANRTLNQQWWANAIAEEVEEDMQALPAGMTEHQWGSRNNVYSSNNYGEINENNFDAFNANPANSEVAATILEVAFHDTLIESQLMRDPKVRDWVARASYHAAAKYFSTWAGTNTTLLPEPPRDSRATTDASGNVTVNWTTPITGAASGGAGAATGYKILVGTSGYTWSDAVTLGNVTSHTFAPGTLPAGETVYFKVVATNAGGESAQRDVVAAKTQSGRKAPILIVNGFDRFDRTTNNFQAWSGNNGVTERPRIRYQNTRDYVVQYAEAVEAFNPQFGVETAQNEQVANGAVNLANYHTVLWISGEESNVDQAFSATERSLLASFLGAGGKLFVSGSEIGWHLDQSGADPAFYNNVFRADFVSDDANSYSTSGAPGSIFAGITAVNFDNGSDANGTFYTYDVDAPDVIAPANGSTAALTYSTGGTAAVQYASGNMRLVNMAFPFETITNAGKRNQVMAAALGFFGTTSTLASATPGTPDLIAAHDTGSSNTDNLTNRDNSGAGRTLTFTVGGTVSGSTVTIYADGVAIGAAIATGSTTTVTTTGVVDLADGTRSITARQAEPGKDESPDSAPLALTIETAAPTVTQVFVGSAAWAANFSAFLASAGLGEAPFGFRMAPGEQPDELPWTNLNRLSIRFSENVVVAPDDLAVHGVNVANYAVQSFAYDPATFTATWTLDTTGVAADKLLLAVSTDVADASAGNALTLPVQHRLDVVPGDVNRSGGMVNAGDVTQTRNRQFTDTANPGDGPNAYSVFHDVNGNGVINAQDVTLTRNKQFTALPDGEPSPSLLVQSAQTGDPRRQPLEPISGLHGRLSARL